MSFQPYQMVINYIVQIRRVKDLSLPRMASLWTSLNNVTHTQVHTNANIPWHIYKTTPAHTLAHLVCVVQLLGRNHRLSQERDGHLAWEQGEGEIRAKGGKANGEKERERKRTSGCNTALEGILHFAICNACTETLTIHVAPRAWTQTLSYKQQNDL